MVRRRMTLALKFKKLKHNNPLKIKTGSEVYWNDPDDGLCSRYCTIASVNVEKGTATIDDGTEVLLTELI